MSGPLPAAIYRRRRLLLVWLVGVLAAVAVGGASWVASDGDEGSDSTSGGDQASVRSDGTAPTSVPTSAPGPSAPSATSTPPAPTSTTTPTGEFTLASGDTEVVGDGPLRRYTVEVEDGTGVDLDEFADEVDAVLGDRRGWTTADGIALQRVATREEAELTVRLTTPDTTDRLCFPLDTGGEVSCGHRGMAVLNLERWLKGAEPSKLDLTDYRAYLVTHEVGHLLGYGHVPCPGPGELAPTMMQQTLSIGACEPNPWPVPGAE
ncbi:hypothetical protein BH23ACT2_BH23ACT2_13310 [soil metagenome]